VTAPLRCRIGLHSWARSREADPELSEPHRSARSVTRCRICRRERAEDAVGTVSLLLFAAVLAAGAVLLVFSSPLLGAVLVVGAFSGLMWSCGPALFSFFARWLSVGR
jgi:hypothetical protein